MSIADYLSSLGWDANKWTVLKNEEWQPLTRVSGYQNNMFDAVRDPEGRKLFGKDARIVEKKWMNKHMASVTESPEPKEEKPTPPPAPPVAPKKEVPAVPEPPKAPEKLQEIADASPNVVIASIPKQEEEEKPKKNENGINVELRIAQLENTGWKKEEDFYVARNGNKIKIDYVATLDDSTFYKSMADGNTSDKVTEDKTEDTMQEEYDKSWKPSEEDIKKAKEADDAKRKKVEEEAEAKRKAEDEASKKERGDIRISFLEKSGCEIMQPDAELEIAITPDGKEFTFMELAEMENKKWMEMTQLYSAKAVRDMKAKKTEEAAKAAIDKGKEETEEEFVNDLKGKIIDKETIEVEMPTKSTEEKQDGVTPEGTPTTDNSMTTGDQGGFFHALSKLGFGQPNLSLKPLADGKFHITITINGDEIDTPTALQLVSDASIKE